jgi:hypothetical protein
MKNHGHPHDPSHRGVNFSHDKSEFQGTWITEDIYASPCTIKSEEGNRIKSGWELETVLIYCDKNYRLWIETPGYLWDGPSYPSIRDGWVGKTLRWLIGDRKKKGLLAASAIHDMMVSPAQVIQIEPSELKEWENIANLEQLYNKIESKDKDFINIGIVEAARIYYRMLEQWPHDLQTITQLKRIKQLVGLVIFQPFYRLFITGPSKTIWKKIS